MKLPIRLENAITKLYTAFHNNTLNAFDCKACAVGNILDNSDEWQSFFGCDVSVSVSGIIWAVNETEEIQQYQKNGYNETELQKIEAIFLDKYLDGIHPENPKETQFKGLCAVVEYLCELDNIPNVMDYTKLFETENNQPKHQLSL